MEHKILNTFHAVNETATTGRSYIVDGISLEVAPPARGDKSKTNPEELLALSLATCMSGALKFVLSINKLSNKSRVDVIIFLYLNRETKTYELITNLYVQVENMSLDDVNHYTKLAKTRCPISNALNQTKNYYTHVISFGEIPG